MLEILDLTAVFYMHNVVLVAEVIAAGDKLTNFT